MIWYFLTKNKVFGAESKREYSRLTQYFYEEARSKDSSEVKKIVGALESNSSRMRSLLIRIGLSKEDPRLTGYKIRLEEIGC